MTRPPQSPQEPHVITELLAREGDRVALRSRTIRLEILSGPNAGQSHELPGPEVRIGTGRHAHLVLLDGAVSRQHLTLRIERRGIRVIDEGSSNGTTLDGVPIHDGYARPGSLVVLGETTIRPSFGSAVVEIALSSRERFGALVGKSIAMRRVFTLLERVAAIDESLLVHGETGTGKELVAEAVHEESRRSSGPFVVFDCSAVTPSLLESELFGHARGAFTGANGDRIGAFESADGGTLFLDEIGELPLELQAKLLRAVERREVRRVGENEVRRADVRVIAATHRNLGEEVTHRRFREDLYYRLAVIRVELPPLRARLDDIPLLVDHFVAAAPLGGRVATLPDGLKTSLVNRAWPGNVRELKNAVARALALGEVDAASPLSPPPGSPMEVPLEAPGKVDLRVSYQAARDRIVEDFEVSYFVEALRASGGNATKAAHLAGVNRKFIQRAIKRYGLRAILDDE